MDGLLSAIEDAVPTMASVVCRLIGRYAFETPYIWSINGLDASAWRIDGGSAKFTGSVGYGYGWHKIVSTACISEGPPTWTIDATISVYNVFIGVATNAENLSFAESRICCSDSWTVFGDTTKIHKFDGYQPAGTTAVRFSSDHMSIRFRVDPSAKRITALFNDADSTELVLMTAATDDVFWSLRPAVIIAGPASVSIRNPEGTGIPT
jgi:hypothetical protein